MLPRRTKDLALSFRQLGTMLGAGLPLTQALNTLASGHQGGWESMFSTAEEHVRRGQALSDGLRPAAHRLGPAVMGLLEAGERVGRQDEACHQIAEVLELRVRTRREISRELAYPVIVLVIGLLLAPLPRLVAEGANAYLAALVPPGLILLGLVVVVLGLRHWSGFQSVRQVLDRVVLAIPVVRTVVATSALARLARGLALGSRAGLPLEETLQLASESAGNLYIRNRIVRYVRARGPAADVVSGVISTVPQAPPMAVQLARTGEATGDLDRMLDKLAEYLEEENRHRRQRAIKLFGVGVYLLVAAWVALHVIGFWVGLYGTLTG